MRISDWSSDVCSSDLGCWQSGPTPAPDAPAVWSRYRSPAVTDNASLQQRRQAAIPRGVVTAMPIFAERAENAELWDADGRRHVDFAGGFAVLNVGHRHPKGVAAVRVQDRKSTRLNSSQQCANRMPSYAFNKKQQQHRI